MSSVFQMCIFSKNTFYKIKDTLLLATVFAPKAASETETTDYNSLQRDKAIAQSRGALTI